MCRFAAYAGPAAPLSLLMFDGEHSLEHQAYAPRELLSGTVNVDGSGVAWWDGTDPDPIRYVTGQAPWADPNLRHLSQRTTSSRQLAAVRSATPGLPFGPANVAPFTSGRLAGAHNGWIGGFRGALGKALVSSLSDARFAELHAVNDSRVLFLHIADRHAETADLNAAVEATLVQVGSLVRQGGEHATLNLLVGDGEEFVAARHSVGAPANSLYWLSDGASVITASEPLDQRSEWKPVPEDHLIRFSNQSVSIVPIKGIT